MTDNITKTNNSGTSKLPVPDNIFTSNMLQIVDTYIDTVDTEFLAQDRGTDKGLIPTVTNSEPTSLAAPDVSLNSCPSHRTYECLELSVHGMSENTNDLKYYMLEAVEKGIYDAYNSIGKIYYNNELYDMAIEYYHKALDSGVKDPESIYNLAIIYDAVNGDFDNADKYYLMAYNLGYQDAILNLAEMYLEHARVANDYAKSAKYLMYAVNMGNKFGFIDFIGLLQKAYSEDTILNIEDLNLTENDITTIISLAKQHPEDVSNYVFRYINTANVFPEWFRGPWESLLTELNVMAADKFGPEYMNYFNLKRRKLTKHVECGVCLSEGPVPSVPFNWCMHYVCLTCYPKLWDKPCPFCRLE